MKKNIVIQWDDGEKFHYEDHIFEGKNKKEINRKIASFKSNLEKESYVGWFQAFELYLFE